MDMICNGKQYFDETKKQKKIMKGEIISVPFSSGLFAQSDPKEDQEDVCSNY